MTIRGPEIIRIKRETKSNKTSKHEYKYFSS
jgi:hypothetical protein